MTYAFAWKKRLKEMRKTPPKLHLKTPRENRLRITENSGKNSEKIYVNIK